MPLLGCPYFVKPPYRGYLDLGYWGLGLRFSVHGLGFRVVGGILHAVGRYGTIGRIPLHEGLRLVGTGVRV